MDYPAYVSFTLTNACNLRCQMCGQWSQEGYIRGNPERLPKSRLGQLQHLVPDGSQDFTAHIHGDLPD